MPQQDDQAPTYLIVILVVVVFITFVLVGFYLYTAKSKTPKSLPFSTTTTPSPEPNLPVSTKVYEGFVQEISAKSKTVDGVTYTHVIGLLDNDGESAPVWITEDEYNALTVYDLRGGNKVVIPLDDVKAGYFVHVIRTTTLSLDPPNSTIEIEIIS